MLADSKPLVHPQFENARVRTPLLLSAQAGNPAIGQEWFGPIAFVVATDSTEHSIQLARDSVIRHGALSLSAYTTDDAVAERIQDAAEVSGVSLSLNLTGAVFVNQTAAFSDFTAPAPTPPPTPRCRTRPSSPIASAWSRLENTCDPEALRASGAPLRTGRAGSVRPRLCETSLRWRPALWMTDMSYQDIQFDLSGGIARLTLNRPDKLNSFTANMHGEVADAMTRVENEGARVLVLTGAGRGFCAGQDLSERRPAADGTPPDLGETVDKYYGPLVRRINALPMPVVVG